MPGDWDERPAAARVDIERLEAVVASLDDLAEQWDGLRIGESVTLEWPRPERREHRCRLGRVERKPGRFVGVRR